MGVKVLLPNVSCVGQGGTLPIGVAHSNEGRPASISKFYFGWRVPTWDL